MNTDSDYERLMTDALDGSLTESEQVALAEHFRRHPQELAIFESMRAMDQRLRTEPIINAPPQLIPNVMGRVARASRVPLNLKTPQIVFIIGIISLLFILLGVLFVAFYTLISPAFPQTELSGVIAFAHVVMDVVVSLVSVAIAFTRAFFSRPLAWLIVTGLFALVAAWIRIIAALYIPRFALNTIG
jgi:anti-sigma factor RsiW